MECFVISPYHHTMLAQIINFACYYVQYIIIVYFGNNETWVIFLKTIKK